MSTIEVDYAAVEAIVRDALIEQINIISEFLKTSQDDYINRKFLTNSEDAYYINEIKEYKKIIKHLNKTLKHFGG